MDSETVAAGCIRDLADVAALVLFSVVGFWILPKLDINPWWSPLAGTMLGAAYVFLALISNHLQRAAGAAFLRRVEAERAASVRREFTDEELEDLKADWNRLKPAKHQMTTEIQDEEDGAAPPRSSAN